jgi:hypothetical protein
MSETKLGDINVPNYDSINGTPLANPYEYSKIKGDSFHGATCSPGLDQHNNDVNSTLLDHTVANIRDSGLENRY